MARPIKLPTSASPHVAFIAPQLATLVDAAPEGDDWLHELKFDGFRILCHVARAERGKEKRVTLLTRTGQDWTDRFPEIAAAARALPVKNALLDGEAAIVRADGSTSFQALQNHLRAGASGTLAYFAFDLLSLDGRDLRPLPLEERKQALEKILSSAEVKDAAVLRFSDHVVGNGRVFFEQASAAGLEGIVSKRRGEPYHSGRSPGWLKTKAIKRQELVVGGFTEPEGIRAGIGALLVGFFEGRNLVYAGKVGTGFGRTMALELRRKLDDLRVPTSPFAGKVPGAGRQVHWVRPRLVVEIAFSEITADGKLRHPSFQGLREDKPATEVVRESPR